MTRFAPNRFWDISGSNVYGDQLVVPWFCTNEPGQMLPCTSIWDQGNAYAGAKSRHPGGIKALLGDGSVQFIKDSINPWVWVAVISILGAK
jgi:hypothetical protein